MDMQAVLKAGGVGVVVLIILTVLGYIPCVGCITFILSLLAYAGIGVLGAFWMAPPRTSGSGAKVGAAAATLAALIAGIIGLIINSIYFAITGSSQMAQAFADLPPEQLQMMSEIGLNPAMFAGGMGILGVLGIGAACCGIWLIVAAGLGAAGGAFWGSSHPN